MLQRNGAYSFYRVMHRQSLIGLQKREAEERQVQRITPEASANIGFVCPPGFDFEPERHFLITGKGM